MSVPRVSVLMSVYNGEPFVRLAVQSILEQTFTDFEFVIVDDGSTDGGVDFLRDYRDARIQLIRNDTNLGLTKSLNIGLKRARGEFVARQDADDISWPGRLARQAAFLREHPTIALVGAQAYGLLPGGRTSRLGGWPKSTAGIAAQWQLMFDNPVVHSSAMFRRSIVWSELRGYDENFRTNQDFELWSRVAATHEIANLPDRLVTLRLRAHSVSSTYSAADLERVRQVFAANRRRLLQDESLVSEGLDVVVKVNRPRALAGIDISALSDADCAIYRKFIALHPAARHSREITLHRAVTLARTACMGARYGSRGAVRMMLHACRVMPSTLATWGPRFALSAIRGAGRRLVFRAVTDATGSD